jgi:hypothetical protein
VETPWAGVHPFQNVFREACLTRCLRPFVPGEPEADRRTQDDPEEHPEHEAAKELGESDDRNHVSEVPPGGVRKASTGRRRS